jgi:hypothetical protein
MNLPGIRCEKPETSNQMRKTRLKLWEFVQLKLKFVFFFVKREKIVTSKNCYIGPSFLDFISEIFKTGPLLL